MFFSVLLLLDALNHYDGGVRTVEGATATAAIWATYPQTYVSTWNCLGDQVQYHEYGRLSYSVQCPLGRVVKLQVTGSVPSVSDI